VKPAKTEAKAAEPAKPLFQPTEVKTTGSVTVRGKAHCLSVVAGLWSFIQRLEDTDAVEAAAKKSEDKDKDEEPKAEASMFYAAYFRDGAPDGNRPITFLFNGGPGSSSLWLHMGAFGPVRVQALDERHTPAPYSMVNNDHSLLDVSDSSSSTRPAPASAASRQGQGERPSTESTRTSTPSPSSSRNSCRSTAAGTRPNMCSAKLRHHARRGLVACAAEAGRRPQRPDPRLRHPQLGSGARRPAGESRRSTWPMSSRCRPMRRRPGITTGSSGPRTLRSFLDQVEAYATSDYALALMKGNELPADERSASRRGFRPTPAFRRISSEEPTCESNMARSRRSFSPTSR
jgi:hypothetical protein